MEVIARKNIRRVEQASFGDSGTQGEEEPGRTLMFGASIL